MRTLIMVMIGALIVTSAEPLEQDVPWIYSQGSGQLKRNGVVVAIGYSGGGEGKNNPRIEQQRDVGPIPHGVYHIGRPRNSSRHGPHSMTLTPVPGTQTWGRSGFLIHADSIEHPGEASEGCIIFPLRIRQLISSSRETTLVVEP
ncbi:tlde1 domain-containing protein [Paraburkholderia sp. GAS448]|uniref:tlde1 domain-containing protein n=1 Tax=Paraburkholderia sp. GAS448 TaxID=3035136 RepID=UPI003D1AE4BA